MKYKESRMATPKELGERARDMEKRTREFGKDADTLARTIKQKAEKFSRERMK